MVGAPPTPAHVHLYPSPPSFDPLPIYRGYALGPMTRTHLLQDVGVVEREQQGNLVRQGGAMIAALGSGTRHGSHGRVGRDRDDGGHDVQGDGEGALIQTGREPSSRA